ncbi:unnamed protein product [Rotaria sordida]|uniref:Transposase n=1 Tax=Rotaria sordida TaxID=392033 RepID=A0A818SI19_9BILA|nr:unnamed protein product [Rotaria sordida]
MDVDGESYSFNVHSELKFDLFAFILSYLLNVYGELKRYSFISIESYPLNVHRKIKFDLFTSILSYSLNIRDELKLNLVVFIESHLLHIGDRSKFDNENNTEDILVIVPDIVNNSLFDTEMTCEKIHMLLKKKSLIITDASKKHTAKCWKRFGFPAATNKDGDVIKIFHSFVSCQTCFTTYSFKSNSTTLMNGHKCNDSSFSSSVINSQNHSQSLKQSNIFSYTSKTVQSVKLKECEKNKIKKLQAEWVCTNIRPFSVVDDSGLRSLVQECISLGAKYGNICVDDVLYSRFSISSHIAGLADECRAKVRQELIEPLENQAVTVCPDLWTDPYRQISYLGISVCFTNDKYQFITYDLCCAPFTENDKKAPSIIAAIKKALEPFGITDLTKVNFVSDRGANFVKALKPYSTTNCVAHRLNNIVKVGFYQTKKKRKNNKIDSPEIFEIICSSDSENDTDCSGDEDRESSETNDKHLGDNKSVRRATSSCILDYSTIKLSEIPPSALNILKTIVSCKLVNGLNKLIQDHGGLAIVQSTIVRWISLISLLESIKQSYKQPFKQVLVIIQKGKAPSLHLVTIVILTLRQALESYSSLIEYNKNYEIDQSSEDLSENEDEYVEEEEGMHFFRLRIHHLLYSMFKLEPIHLAATLLHPRYRLLKKCSLYEVRECHLYIRQRMAQIKSMKTNKSTSDISEKHSSTVNNETLNEPVKKKPKRFGEDFETGNVSDEFDNEYDDELHKYLEQRIDTESIDDNPLPFWYQNRLTYPILSQLARSIYSIPASTANVERTFSGSGMMINSRRTRLNPEQINNAMFLRSVKKNE